MSKFKRTLLILGVAAVVSLMAVTVAHGYTNSVTYTGQGLTKNSDGSYIINNELCGVVNGADTEGPYMLWVLTATGAAHANISFFGASPVAMTKSGNGAFKYIGPWIDPSTLVPNKVVATYDGKAKNVQLVISHGCAPKRDNGAWCSPGYWRNTIKFNPNGWTTIGVTPPGPLYNDVISTPTVVGSPTLLGVLNAPQTYGGAAFNAVGAYLTGLIPGYVFDPSLVGTDDSCPLDAHGNLK